MPLNLFKKKKPQDENLGAVGALKSKPGDIKKNTLKEQDSDKYANPMLNQIIDIKAKEKEIKRKKRRFKSIAWLVIIALLTISISPSAVSFYKRYFVKPIPKVAEPEINYNNGSEENLNPENIVEYKSDEFKISLEYLGKASLYENFVLSDLTKKIEVIYDKNNEGENTSLDSLTEGYIFRISIFPTSLRKIDEIAQVKKDVFAIECPETTIITDTQGTNIDSVDGRTFEVKNCGADYVVTYVVKNGLNYEFAQIFKGDLGYRQLYKAETEDIVRSVKFYPETHQLGPTEIYESTRFKISFEYPRSLDSECCNITGPMAGRPILLLTLGDPENYVNENNLDAIAFFTDENKVGDFNDYLETQKILLSEDYLVTKGQSPKPQIRSVKVGDREAVMLRGYSWRGNDLIYVDITPTNERNRVLVISIHNISGESFEKVTDSILESFEFF
ncbi:hypothetical protein K0B04_00705 [Patescibacteria group bacterium]|nr:hypothetical protein [Patescibacteria group bacterium]